DRYCCCQCPNASMDQNSWSSAYSEINDDLFGMCCGCRCPGCSDHRPASSSILRYYQPRRGLACRVIHMGVGRISTVGALVDLESAYRLRLSTHPLTSQRHEKNIPLPSSMGDDGFLRVTIHPGVCAIWLAAPDLS